MNTVLSLSPLLRSGVGFERLHELFESLRENENAANSYPPYNIAIQVAPHTKAIDHAASDTKDRKKAA